MGAADTGPDQNATDGGAAEVYALPFPKQFGQVGVVGSPVLDSGQLHHCGSLGF